MKSANQLKPNRRLPLTPSTDFAGHADLNGAPLYYEVTGSGEPLLLIHAGIADSRMWSALAAAFSSHRRVITFDLRGFGRSHVPANVIRHHDDVRALLAHLDIDRTDLIGISFGGRVALDFALTYPEHVGKLILGAPSIGGAPPSPEMDAFGDEEDALLESGDLDAASDLNVRFWVDGPRRGPDEVHASVRHFVHTMQRDAFTVPFPEGARFESLTPPAYERLYKLSAPLLVIVGDTDHDMVIERSRELAQTVHGARLIVMPNAGHMMSLEYPDVFKRHVREFLGF
jgi:pimeloyl-ACP methyl ester carboxylesterase